MSLCAGLGCSSGDGTSRGDAPAAAAGASAGHGTSGQGGSGGTTGFDVGNAPSGPDTGGAPAASGGEKPGTFMPSAMLDPNAEFDWPEAQAGGKCEPGTYVGNFSCIFMIDPAQADMLLFPPPADMPPVTGPITLTFQKSENGEFLELTDARLDGIAMDYIGFDAQLEGRLDCATLELTASVTSGEFGFGSPVLLQFGEIAGDLSGTLDAQAGVLSGVWKLGVGPVDMQFGACEGPWTANFTP